MAIKYKDFEKREQLRKDYIDKAAEAAKTQANAYTDEQIRNIPAPPAPDIPTALPQKYEAFKVQLVQDDLTWEEYHKPLWNGSQVLTNSSATLANRAHFVTDTVLYWRSPRKYNLLITINGAEKEFVFEGEHNQYGTNWVIWQLKENDVVVAEAECIGAGNGQYYNNTSTVYVYCPDGSPYIGQTMTAARYGKKQYVYTLSAPDAILQYPSETENARFLTMCKSIATKNAKIKLTITDNVIEANYINISNELVTTDENSGGVSYRMIGIVADRKALAVGNSYEDDMPTCIKGILEVEYTDEEATKECVYDKIQGESYTFKIGDFNHDESSAFDYYFNGAILIPFSNAQIQASFTYRPVSGTEKSIQVKSMVNDGQMLPYFDISELFGQAANTVMAIITSNTAVENVDMSGRPITTISLTSNVQNFTDANDEIMVGSILTLTPESLPQKYYRLNTALSKGRWKTTETFDWINGKEADTITTYVASWRFPKASKGAEYSIKLSDGTTGLYTVTGQNQQFSISINVSKTPTDAQTAITVRLEVNADGSARILCSGANKEYHYIYTTIIVNNTSFYELANSAIKVNSEVRYILDANSYTIAKSIGLRKLIDKTEGKLRFTAELPPTSSIGSYLVVGETSAEGLAYIDDVLYSIPTNFPQTYKKKAVTLATSGWHGEQTDAWNGSAYIKDGTQSFQLNKNCMAFGAKMTIKTSSTSTTLSGTLSEDGTKWTYPQTRVDSLTTITSATLIGSEVTMTFSSMSGKTYTSISFEGDTEPRYAYTDADVKVNSEVRFTLDETNGKLAGQFGLKQTIDKEAGKLTFTADTKPTSAISGTLEIGETSTEGAAFVEGITSDTTGFVKATEENTFTKTQTFNGTESQAGIKTNAIDNENGNRVVYFNGTKQLFGSDAIPAQVRTSEQRLKLERPVSGGTGTEVIEVANLADVSSGGGTAGKVFTFTKDDILMFGHEVSFPMGTDKNYSNGSRTVYNLNSANRLGMLQFEVGKKYKLQWRTYGEGSDWTTVYAIASSITLSDGTTTAKAEFTVNGKTLVVVDRATATANITSTSDLIYGSDGAVAYFSDFSTVEENVGIKVFTVPKQYIVRIPYDEVILPTSIVAIYGDNIAPTTVEHKSSYIELNYGISSSVYYNDVFVDPTNYNHSQYLIGTKYYLEVVGGSTTGGAYFVGRRENVFDKHAVIKVADWTSETEGTFKWTDASIKPTGLLSGEIVNVGLVWNSDVELEFDTETDKETFEAAGCKIVKGKFLATALTITCTTKPTKPICFTYTVRNNAR